MLSTEWIQVGVLATSNKYTYDITKKTTAIENDRTTAVERIMSERHEPQPSTAQTVSALNVSNVT